MAAKLLHSLADDNPDLQKQIGCMAGIFHVFDRQHLLSGKRPNQRRLLPPPSSSSSKFSNGSMDADSTNPYSRNVVKSGSNKCVNEKQTEPPRPAFISSSSSSNSSLRTVQPDASLTDRIICPGTHPRDPVICQTSGSPRISGDIRDVIKDSIHKDSRGLSVQTKTKAHVSHRTLKPKDSPRPLQLSKSVHGKQDVVPTDIKESLRILVKLHDGPWYYNDKDLSILSDELKNRSCFPTSRDSPRFSYDGIPKNRKIKDLPRLSLDNRESTAARSSTVDSIFRNLSENEHEQPWASSVVAKLMGLDMLPTMRASSDVCDDPSMVCLRGSDVGKSVRDSKSGRRSCKGLASPQCKIGDQVRKPSSKFPIEPAPWKNLDSRRSSPKQASTQVERLLKDEKERDEQNSGSDRNARMKLNHSGTTRVSESKLKRSSSTSLESSIVIMKPAKLFQRPQSGKLSAISIATNDQIVRDHDRRTNSRNLRAAQTSPRLLQISKDSNTNSAKNSGSISPRLQRKKLEFDKSSSPPNPPSDRRTNNRQSTDQTGSPGGRRRANTCSVRQNDEQLKQKYNKTHTPLKLTVNLETTRRNKQPVEIAYCESYMHAGETSSDGAGDLSIGPEQPSPVSVLDSSAYMMEESLSPVKQTSYAPKDEEVLELHSTMDRKKLQSIDNLVQKLRLLNSTQDESQTDHIASLCKSTNPNDRYISEILVTSGLLLRDLTCSGLSTFQLHPSGHPINPELFFVLEQTKASSFLTNGDTSNPEKKLHRKLVFDVVNEILARKLNLVDPPPTEPWFKPEKLAKKALSAQMALKELCSEIDLLLQDKSQEFSLEEADRVKSIVREDVTHDRKDKWIDFRCDLSRVVLDIERSIFKDLVNEILMSLSSPRRLNRKLFSS